MDISDLLKNEEVQRYVKHSTKTVSTMIYNEIYPYVWLICIYSVLLFLMVLLNFVWLIRLVSSHNNNQSFPPYPYSELFGCMSPSSSFASAVDDP